MLEPRPLKVETLDLAAVAPALVEAFAPLVRTQVLVPEYTMIPDNHLLFSSLTHHARKAVANILHAQSGDILASYPKSNVDLVILEGLPAEKKYDYSQQLHERRMHVMQWGRPVRLTTSHCIELGVMALLDPMSLGFLHISGTQDRISWHQDGSGTEEYGILAGMQLEGDIVPKTAFCNSNVSLCGLRSIPPSAVQYGIQPGTAVLWKNTKLLHTYVPPENAHALNGRRTLLRLLAHGNVADRDLPSIEPLPYDQLVKRFNRSKYALCREIMPLQQSR